jgi:hypothetical protein
MNAASDDVTAYTARRPGLDWLLTFLWKGRRKNSATSAKKAHSPETGLFFGPETCGDRAIESELMFISMMWFGL